MLRRLLCCDVTELIHTILTDAANATQTTLRSNDEVDDGGAASSFAVALYDYVTGGSGGGDVHAITGQFFDRLFAAAYLRGAVGVDRATVECVAGVRLQREGDGGAVLVPPFDGGDSSVGDDLTRSARVARGLLDSLRLVDVVVRSLRSFDFGHQCSRALTRLRYCSACDGVVDPAPPRPCRQFCANVARGCLVHLASGQVGRAWQPFVDAVHQLTVFGMRGHTDLQSVVEDLPRRLSDEMARLQGDLHRYHPEVRFQICHCKKG